MFFCWCRRRALLLSSVASIFSSKMELIFMPQKPMKPCRHPGCPMLTAETFCQFHARLHAKDRPSANDRGYDHYWQKASKRYLKANPLCGHCQEKGLLVTAEVVDHIVPHRGDRQLFWDEENWQPLCKKCHDRKTRLEDQCPEYRY